VALCLAFMLGLNQFRFGKLSVTLLLNMKSKKFLMLIYLYTYKHRLYLTSLTAFNSNKLQTDALSFIHQHCIYSILSGMLVMRACILYWTDSLQSYFRTKARFKFSTSLPINISFRFWSVCHTEWGPHVPAVTIFLGLISKESWKSNNYIQIPQFK
jgi:hypothetical protein